MGQVFKARHVSMDRVVAIKVIPKERVSDPVAVGRFYQEVRAVAQLSHPNIVMAFEVNQVGRTHYLAMEYVDGIDLARLVQQSGPLRIPQACESIRQVALGLQHAHERGLVHRDIKPGNLMVARRGSDEPPVIKILDFGLARFESESTHAGRLTQFGKIMGTVDYMAPEQAENPRAADIRADIYSLGCSLYYLLTGKPPFPGKDLVEKLSARTLDDAPSVRNSRPEVSPALDQVLAKMMARSPAGRYQTPREVAQALLAFVRPGANRDAGGALPPPLRVASPQKITVIDGDTGELAGIRLRAAAKAPARKAAAKDEATNPFVGLGEVAATPKVPRSARDPAKPATAKRHWRRPVLAGVGVVLLALLGMWAGGVFKENKQDGIGQKLEPGKSQDRPSVFKENTQDRTGQGEEIPHEDALLDREPHIEARFHDGKKGDNADNALPEPTMRFGLVMLREKDPREGKKLKRLTFDEFGRSNNTCARVDGAEHLFGSTDGKWRNRKGRFGSGGVESVWESPAKKIVVRQRVEIVGGEQSRLLDTCRVRYILENQSEIEHKVGIRFMLDTFIGTNDGVPFTIPGHGLCDTKMEFQEEVPDFFLALEHDDLRDPGTVALVQFKPGGRLESPDRVTLGAWPHTRFRDYGIRKAHAQMTGWDVPVLDIRRLNELVESSGEHADPDSCVVMYWNEQPLAPGKTREVGFSYGLGAVVSGEGGQNRLGLTAGGRFVPSGSFTFMALVKDPQSNEKLTLTLPPGLELLKGGESQLVPVPEAQKYSAVTWMIKAASEGKYKLRVKSSKKTEQSYEVRISGEDATAPPVPAEGTIRLRLPDYADASKILIDGQPREADKLAHPLRLSPGEHRLEVSGTGLKPLELTFTIKPGDNPSLDVPVTRNTPLELQPGILAVLYRGQFDKLVGTRVDPSIDLSQDRPVPEGQAVWWRGFLSAPRAGTYRLYFMVDDAVSLWLDGKLLLDEWKWRGTEKSREVKFELSPQPVPVEVKYYNIDGSYGLNFKWVPPGATQAVPVPPEVFRHDPLLAEGVKWRAARPAAEPDERRTVATWALGLGGKVTIRPAKGEPREIRTTTDLPSGPFTLDTLDLAGNAKAIDAELKTLFRRVPLKKLVLADTQVGDAGLFCCEGLRDLEELDLSRTAITDTSLMALHRHSGLRRLDLRGTKTTAAGVERLRVKLPGCTIER
jgi:tRNA A-37 threonylcarbamoyl transferase component Bud32